MTKEIEDAARDLIGHWNVNGVNERLNPLLQQLSKALTPKPTREECIEFLQYKITRGNEPNEFDSYIDATIELLQEPQKGVWIKNKNTDLLNGLGGNTVVVRLTSGGLQMKVANYINWLDVEEYMIIEE